MLIFTTSIGAQRALSAAGFDETACLPGRKEGVEGSGGKRCGKVQCEEAGEEKDKGSSRDGGKKRGHVVDVRRYAGQVAVHGR
jgi:hypothetical protein